MGITNSKFSNLTGKVVIIGGGPVRIYLYIIYIINNYIYINKLIN